MKQQPRMELELSRTTGDYLTRRQAQVAELVSKGIRTAEIAFELGISEETVLEHIERARKKLGARNRTDLVSQLWMHGILQARTTTTAIVLVLCFLSCMPSARSYRSPVRTQTRVSQAVRARSRDEFHEEILA